MSNSIKKHRIHLLYPYMFSLAILNLALEIGGWMIAYLIGRSVKDDSIFYIIGAVVLFMVGIYIWNGYEFLGLWRIKEDGICFYSLLRRPRMLLYSQIRYIGIDFGILNGVRVFWIYFSELPIEEKYRNNIIRKPFKKNSMRISYNKKAFDELVKGLPADLSKRLERSYSVIRLYHADKD